VLFVLKSIFSVLLNKWEGVLIEAESVSLMESELVPAMDRILSLIEENGQNKDVLYRELNRLVLIFGEMNF